MFLHMPASDIYSYSLKFFLQLTTKKIVKGQLLDLMESVYLTELELLLTFVHYSYLAE